MSFISEDELKGKSIQSMAPMIDFLFIMLMFFASLAISRITTKETDVDLVTISKDKKNQEHSDYKIINLSINENGKYKWITEIHDYDMDSPIAITQELTNQFQRGLLPEDKKKTLVLLKIDKKAQWDPILKLIFAIRDAGFEVRPLYRVETDNS